MYFGRDDGGDEAHAAADSRVPAPRRRARGAVAARAGVARASGVGRPAGQHAAGGVALAARARRGGRADDVGHPSLAQLWGPRYNTYVVAEARLRAVLARAAARTTRRAAGAPRDGRARECAPRRPPADRPRGRAARSASATRSGTPRRRAPSRSAGKARGRRSSGPSRAADIDPADALPRARAALPPHLRADDAPTGSRAGRVSRGARVPPRSLSLEGSLAAVRSPLGDEWLLADDEQAMRAGGANARARAPAAERRCLLPARPSRAGAARPVRRAARAALDLSRLARSTPRRRRDPRHLEARQRDRADRRLDEAARARRATRSRPRRAACPSRVSTARSRSSGRRDRYEHMFYSGSWPSSTARSPAARRSTASRGCRSPGR